MKKYLKQGAIILVIVLFFGIFAVLYKPEYVNGVTAEAAVSIGKSYTTTPPPYIASPDTNNAELTNGIFGIALDRFNGSCSGYTSDVTTVIDLENDGKELFKFEVSYMVLSKDDIGPIRSAAISVSDDNINWKTIGSVAVPKIEDPKFQKAVLELENTVSGRYVKFEIKKTDTYLLLDELTVYGMIITDGEAPKVSKDILVPKSTDILPDGAKFDFWDCRTNFKVTYYVDNTNENASDDNDGSEDMPFRTINKAASVVQPGERVLIKEGVYYEVIRDVNGGTDEKNMVLFEGQGNVVITGAVVWDYEFTPSKGLRETGPKGERDLFSPNEKSYYANNDAKVFMGKVPADAITDGYNPFAALNLPPIYFGASVGSVPLLLEEKSLDVFNPDSQLMKRGLLFCDGERMEQVLRPFELWEKPGTYWVDESGRYIHFRLRDDKNPEDCILELAIKEQGFVPEESGLSYIYLKNLNFVKFSNPFPAPQKGAISTNCGHHFIIENCIIKDVNSIGLDMGFLSHYNLHDGIRGYHIVRNSSFINCGISGISALPTRGEYLKGILVENNTFSGNCWHDTEPIWECAAIKSHYTEDSIYRNNIIEDTYFGVGIWLDKAIKNTRITNNIILGIHNSLFGGIQIEATYDKNLVDHNYIYGTGYRMTPLGVKTGGHGIFLNEVDNIGIYGNMMFNLVGDGIFTPDVTVPRLIGTENPKATTGSGNVIKRNLIQNSKRGITLLTRYNYTDENVFGNISNVLFLIRKEKKQVNDLEGIRNLFRYESKGVMADISVKFDRDTLCAELTVNDNTQILNLNEKNALYNYVDKLLNLVN